MERRCLIEEMSSREEGGEEVFDGRDVVERRWRVEEVAEVQGRKEEKEEVLARMELAVE